jgi:Galactose binding lectin domain
MCFCLTQDVREYCDWETFNASCAGSHDVTTATERHVIDIKMARYGRMHDGRCVTQSYGNIGCGTDVTAELTRTCSGRVRCSVAVISLYGRRSCPKDFASYLEASYECVRGICYYYYYYYYNELKRPTANDDSE